MITWSTRLAAEIRSAASSAAPNESTLKSAGSSAEMVSRIPASMASTIRKPLTSVNDSLTAATTGGRSAFSTPMNTAASTAPAKLLTWTPDSSPPAIHTASPPTSSAITIRSGENVGRDGFQPRSSAESPGRVELTA